MSSINFNEIIEIFIRRLKLLLATVLLMILSWVIYVFQTPVFKSEILIQVTQNQSALGGLSGIGDVSTAFGGGSVSTNEEIYLISSRDLIGSVVEDLGLNFEIYQKDLLFFTKAYPYTTQKFLRDKIELNVIKSPERSKLIEDLTITRIDSNTLSIFDNNENDYIDKNYFLNKELYLKNIDALISVDKFDFEVDKPINIRYVPPLTTVVALKAKVRSSIEGSSSPFVSGGVIRLSLVDKDRDYLRDILNSIANKYRLKNIELTSAEASKSLKYIDDLLPVVKNDLESSEEELNEFRLAYTPIDIQLETQAKLEALVALDENLNKLKLNEAQLSQIYKRDHPTYKSLSMQIQTIENQQRDINNDISALPETQLEFLRLSREVEANTNIYTELLSRKLELQVIEAGAVGNVRIIDDAYILPGQVSPRTKVSIIVIGFIGMTIFLIMVVFLEFFRRTIRTPSELLQDNKVGEIYGLVPLNEDENEDENYSLNESFQSLITNINFELSSKEGTKFISINGATPKVGKTFITRRIAESLSLTHKVLLVDFDLRRGDLAQKYKLSNQGGLLDNKDPSNLTINKINDNLDFISTGRLSNDVSAIFKDDYIKQRIEFWDSKYDYVVFDTSPIMSINDSLLLTKYLDLMLFVVRQDITKFDEVRSSMQRLRVKENDLPINFIFNAFKNYENIYGYKYFYDYYGYQSYNYKKTDD